MKKKAGLGCLAAFVFSVMVCSGIGETVFLKAESVHEKQEESLEAQEVQTENMEVRKELIVKSAVTGDPEEAEGQEQEIILETGESAILPVRVGSSGCLLLWMEQKGSGTVSASKIKHRLYEDEDCTKEMKLTKVSKAAKGKNSLKEGTVLLEPGEYYLKVVREEDTDKDEEVILSINGLLFSESAQLVSGEWRAVSNVNVNKKIFFSAEARENSIMKLQIEDFSAKGKVYLCDEEKKKISGEHTMTKRKDSVIYVVPKGTYYVCVNTEAPYVRAELKMSKGEDQCGKSRKKARKLSVNGNRKKCMFSIQESAQSEHWYFFENKKEQEIQVFYNGKASGGEFSLEFFKEKTSFGVISLSEDKEDASFAPSSGVKGTTTLPKGKYYMKITKSSGNVSGYYSIQVKAK